MKYVEKSADILHLRIFVPFVRWYADSIPQSDGQTFIKYIILEWDGGKWSLFEFC